MVLTRAQASSAAEAASQDPTVLEGIVTEVEDGSYALVPVSQPQGQELQLQDQVSSIVDNFWNETQRLAAETTALQSNQIQQAQEYRAALTSIQNDARSGTAELAAHQKWIEGQIHQALEETRLGLQQDLQVVANAQVVGKEETRNFVEVQLQSARNQAQDEALKLQQMVTAHAQQAEQRERQIEASVANAHDTLLQRIDALHAERQTLLNNKVDERWERMQQQVDEKFQEFAENSVRECQTRIEVLSSAGGKHASTRRVQKLIAEQEERSESKLKQLLQQAHENMNASHTQWEQRMEQKVDNKSQEIERRMEIRLSEMLKHSQVQQVNELRQHAEATRALDDKVDRSHNALKQEVESIKLRLAQLEVKPLAASSHLPEEAALASEDALESSSLSEPATLASEENLADPHLSGEDSMTSDEPLANSTSSSDEPTASLSQEQYAHIEHCIREEMQKRFSQPPKAVSGQPRGKPSRKNRPKKKPLQRGLKLQRVIAKAQKDVMRRSELAARRHELHSRVVTDEDVNAGA